MTIYAKSGIKVNNTKNIDMKGNSAKYPLGKA